MAQVTLRTNFTPALTFDPGKTDSRPLVGTILKLLKPSLDATLVDGLKTIHYAPYGEPSGMGEFLLVGIFLLALYGGYKLMRGKI